MKEIEIMNSISKRLHVNFTHGKSVSTNIILQQQCITSTRSRLRDKIYSSAIKLETFKMRLFPQNESEHRCDSAKEPIISISAVQSINLK